MMIEIHYCRKTIHAACLFALLVSSIAIARAQTPTPTPAPAQPVAACSAPAACPNVAPLVIKLSVFYKEGEQPWEKSDKVLQLSRKPFFVSSCPFNLEKPPALGQAPSRDSYYRSIKASSQLISWLEKNNCDTVYCRELKREEVTCKSSEPSCVPEFAAAYEEALRKLKNNSELARRWVTNYAPLSSQPLRTGYYEKKREWLNAAIAKIEKAGNLPAGTIKAAMTDRQGVAYFYDLCPGSYYISNVAAIEVKQGEGVLWETEAIKLKKQDASSVTAISLANVDPKDQKKKNKSFFVGRKTRVAVSSAASTESHAKAP